MTTNFEFTAPILPQNEGEALLMGASPVGRGGIFFLAELCRDGACLSRHLESENSVRRTLHWRTSAQLCRQRISAQHCR